jgi:hypothetical protein
MNKIQIARSRDNDNAASVEMIYATLSSGWLVVMWQPNSLQRSQLAQP